MFALGGNPKFARIVTAVVMAGLIWIAVPPAAECAACPTVRCINDTVCGGCTCVGKDPNTGFGRCG